MKKKVLYALVIFISTTATAQYPTDSLQAYYPLDGNADDASMNGFDGVVNGPVPESGMCSMGYGFSDDHIDCGDPTGNEFDLVDDATLALWVKLRSAPATYYTLVGKDVGPGQSLEKWFFAMNTDSLSFHVNGPGLVGGLWCSSGTQSFGLDTFYHVAVTKQGDQYDFFVNGVHVGTDALPVNLPDVTAPLKMGRVDNPGVDHVLDEVFIYNRALSPAEILQLYQICTTGIVEPMNPAELVLQPNPAQNAFTLNFPQQIGPAYLHLLDMAGRRMVFPYKVVPGERVDISALPSGLYTVRLVMDGRTISRLVVVR